MVDINYSYAPAPADNEDLPRYTYDEFQRIQFTFDGILNPEDWHEVGATGEPAFQGTWADGGTNPAFYKDPLGRVHLKGDLDTGTSATVAFTLPEGYRPSEALYYALHQTAAAAGAEALISTNGDVTVTYTGAKVRLSGISFRAA